MNTFMDIANICALIASSQCLTVMAIALLVILTLVALALNGAVTGKSARHKTKQAASQVHRIGSEGRRAMNDLSEQYLDDLFKQATANMDEIHDPNVRR